MTDRITSRTAFGTQVWRITAAGVGNTGFLARAGRLARTAGCAVEFIHFAAGGRSHYIVDLFASAPASETDPLQATADRDGWPKATGASGTGFVSRPLLNDLTALEISGVNHARLIEDIAGIFDGHGVRIAGAEGKRTTLPPADYWGGWTMIIVVDEEGNPRRLKLALGALDRYAERHDLLVKPVRRYQRPPDDDSGADDEGGPIAFLPPLLPMGSGGMAIPISPTRAPQAA
jgi:hypothetical protein